MNKKIIIDGKEPSAEQIRKEADFDHVLKASKGSSGTSSNMNLGFGSAAAVVLIFAAGLWFLSSNSEEQVSESHDSIMDTTIQDDEKSVSIHEAKITIPSETFLVSSISSTNIFTKNGAIISIPDNAFHFVDDNNSPDSVQIVFTEYSDPLAVHLSGINMAYDSAGSKYAFQSGGMLELRAYSNNEELVLNKEKNIDISYPALIPNESLNGYKYDKENQSWDYLGYTPVRTFEDECERKMIRFDNESVKAENTPVHINQELEDLNLDLAALENDKPTKPRKANKDNYRFTLDIDSNEFPKLASMESIEFEVIDPRFNFSYFDKEWEDVKLKKIKNDKFLVQLFEGTKKKEFVVYPVLDGQEFDKAFSNYENVCLEIKSAEDKIKAKQDEYDAWTEENVQKEIQKVKKNISRRLINSFLKGIDPGSLYRNITFDLGIVNFDQPISLPPAGSGVQAKFILVKNSKEEEVKHVTLVNIDKNIYYPYIKSEMNDFRYQKKFKNLVFATSIEGDILITEEEEFASISNKASSHTFYLKVVPEGATSFEELMK